MLRLTWARAAAWRAHRHHLDRLAPRGSLLSVTSRLCGLHAQVLSSAELTAWARVDALDAGAVRRALWQDRTLVKTWAMRGTLHLLPAAELALWYSALNTSPRYLSPRRWQNYFGVSMDDLARLSDAVAAALEGRVMTREELVREVVRITGTEAFGARLAENSWGTILKPAAFSGRLCFGPNAGTRVQFTRPDTWIPGGLKLIDPAAATAEVTRRFLAAHGPATAHDLARWWGGGGVTAARRWIQALGDEAVLVDLAGDKAWLLAGHDRPLREFAPARSVRLLPAFDQYVIAASHHAHQLLPGDVRARVYRQQGWVSPVLLVNGRMEGVWRHQAQGGRIQVTIEPFRPVPAWARRAAESEAERLAQYLDAPADVSWSPMR